MDNGFDVTDLRERNTDFIEPVAVAVLLPCAEVRATRRVRDGEVRHANPALAFDGEVFDDPPVGAGGEIVGHELHEGLVRVERPFVATAHASGTAGHEHARAASCRR